MSTTSSSQTNASSTAASTQDSYDDSQIAGNISNSEAHKSSLVGIVVQCSPHNEPTVLPLPVQVDTMNQPSKKRKKQEDGKLSRPF